MSEDYIAESRKLWHRPTATVQNEDLVVGCLQRIADAVEKMSGSYAAIIAQRDSYQRQLAETQRMLACAERSRVAMRGAITRLKRSKGGAT